MKLDIDTNRSVYDAPDIVGEYTRLDGLQKPEMAILREFDAQWSGMRFLDVGVGAGRTTRHFAPKVGEYVGVDFAPEMIHACGKRFASENWRASYHVGDARDMGMFADGSFDFVCFSYNGIDYVDHEGRLRILREIHRVLRTGGHFFFSTHNVLFAPRLFGFRFSWNPPDLARHFRKVLRRRRHCPDFRRLHRMPHAVINDDSHDFRLSTYYIQPTEQIAQLAGNGFAHTRIYSALTGEVLGVGDQRTHHEHWLYYLCAKA